MHRNSFLVVLISTVLILLTFSCKHEPLNPTDVYVPVVDPPTGGSCDPDSVYFENQVLPILVSNCTESGCHNAQDHKEGVVLISYQSLLSTVNHVTQNDWRENKLIKSLEESDPGDRMPQNKPPLSTEQIDLIKKWITQGAVNNSCDESYGGCDTTAVKYSTAILPIVQTRCKGCHSGSNPQGGIKLTTYAEVKAQVVSGKLYSSVTKSAGWMPKGGAKLDDCSVMKLKAWIDSGAPEN